VVKPKLGENALVVIKQRGQVIHKQNRIITAARRFIEDTKKRFATKPKSGWFK
jgi:hypothetical protein